MHGTVTLKGKPTKDLLVRFLPSPMDGVESSIASSAVTDDSGKYALKHALDGKEGDGAIIGQHRVCIEEANRPHPAQGQPVPPRLVSPDYSMPGTTPLTATVTAGDQEINFDVK